MAEDPQLARIDRGMMGKGWVCPRGSSSGTLKDIDDVCVHVHVYDYVCKFMYMHMSGSGTGSTTR